MGVRVGVAPRVGGEDLTRRFDRAALLGFTPAGGRGNVLTHAYDRNDLGVTPA